MSLEQLDEVEITEPVAINPLQPGEEREDIQEMAAACEALLFVSAEPVPLGDFPQGNKRGWALGLRSAFHSTQEPPTPARAGGRTCSRSRQGSTSTRGLWSENQASLVLRKNSTACLRFSTPSFCTTAEMCARTPLGLS